MAKVELKPPFSLKPGKETKRFIIIQPAEKPIYRDILLCDPAISPGVVSAVWYPKPMTHPNQHQRGRRVFLHFHHFHGGTYLFGSGRDMDMSYPSSQLLASSPDNSVVLCPEYRLRSHEGGRFPAAFQDAITTYAYLINELQIPASDIILSGDSAG